MDAREHPGRLAFGLIALSIAAYQPEVRADPPLRRPVAIRPASDPDAPIHQRLIIRLKDADGKLDAPLRSRDAQLAIADLGNRIRPAFARQYSIPMSLQRSIRPGLHVATTGHGLRRAEMEQLIGQIRQDPRVAYAEIDERIYPQAAPDDPYFRDGKQWNLLPPESGVVGGANLPGAWDLGSGQGVVVAVLDTGITGHRDLLSNILPGYDFVSDPIIANDVDGVRDDDPGDPGDWVSLKDREQATFANCEPSPSSWHGTSMAGTIAAVSANSLDIAGIAPRARILPVRVFGKCGGYVSDVIDGLYWAIGMNVNGVPDNPNPARIINMSMGAGGSCSASFQEAINQARARNALVVAAAGNRDGSSTVLTQPANCTGVIAVTAHTQRADLAEYSNRGADATLSAPGGGTGVNLSSSDWIIALSNNGDTVPLGDDLGYLAGTSIAAAQVSGVAALLLGRQPGWRPDQVKLALTSSARPYPADSYCHGNPDCGAGMLDATAALQWQLNNADPVPPADHPGPGGGGGGAAGWPELLLLLSAALLTRFRGNPLASCQPHETGRAQAAREPGGM